MTGLESSFGSGDRQKRTQVQGIPPCEWSVADHILAASDCRQQFRKSSDLLCKEADKLVHFFFGLKPAEVEVVPHSVGQDLRKALLKDDLVCIF